jgi:hypothetical protein
VKKAKITEEHSGKINSLISVKTFTWQDICNAFDNVYTLNQIQYHVRKYYPDLKSNIVKEYSRGGTRLEFLLKQIFPADKIKAELHIGSKLRVDFIALDPYNLAFEFDGSQHSQFSSHFHGSKHGLEESKARDLEKARLVSRRGLNLVRISELDIDEKFLRKLIDEVGYGSGIIQADALTYKEHLQIQQKEQRTKAKQLQGEYRKMLLLESKKDSFDNSYAEAQKERQREHRKAQYQRQKEWLKKNKK